MNKRYDKEKELDEFLSLIRKHTYRKKNLYDGSNQKYNPEACLRYAIEELGEIASAISRWRYSSAKDECVDLAHCAYLIYLSLLNLQDEEDFIENKP